MPYKNKELELAYRRSPEYVSKNRKRAAKWYKENRKKVLDRMKSRRDTNVEIYRARERNVEKTRDQEKRKKNKYAYQDRITRNVEDAYVVGILAAQGFCRTSIPKPLVSAVAAHILLGRLIKEKAK